MLPRDASHRRQRTPAIGGSRRQLQEAGGSSRRRQRTPAIGGSERRGFVSFGTSPAPPVARRVACCGPALALAAMDQFLPVLLMLVLALVFAVGSFAASRMLAPGGRLNPAKTGPYESGIAPTREPPARFPVRFYLVGMIFIIFDIEVVFLYPFAVMFRQLAVFGLVE